MSRPPRHRLTRIAVSGATLGALLAGLTPSVALATPVGCDFPTPDGRMFPEPLVSISWLTFQEFECGVLALEEMYPDLLDVTTLGMSSGGLPIYNVLMTDETVTTAKRDLLVMSSIHGNEIGAREGAARQIEDMVDPDIDAGVDVDRLLSEYVVNWTFPNPDGWVAGQPTDGGIAWTRANDDGQDLNRNFPVYGWFAYEQEDYFQPEGLAVAKLWQDGDFFLGTDNHGQLVDTFLAAGLQIVGEFNYQKSETLARFGDGIGPAMGEYVSTQLFLEFETIFGDSAGAYHWGTLYDMLGYSASGSGIDYYNTPGEIGGVGFATELTASNLQATNTFEYVAVLGQIWVDSIRAINVTMFRQAIDPQTHTFPVGGEVAYLDDPARVTNSDADGVGNDIGDPGGHGQADYDVSRMKFFGDLNDHADKPITKLDLPSLLAGTQTLDVFDTLVVADDLLPVSDDGVAPTVAQETAWFALLQDWVDRGGNLLLTDAAIADITRVVPTLTGDPLIQETLDYVGSVESFTDRSHPLNAGLRGVASQTFDTVPIGFSFGGSLNSAPNWEINQSAWEAAGGFTAGTHSSGWTIHGELPVGDGRVRILGALLPQPTEERYHPFGLLNYAVTYTGYELLANHLVWENPGRVEAAQVEPTPAATTTPEPAPEPLPATGGGLALAVLGVVGAAALSRRRS